MKVMYVRIEVHMWYGVIESPTSLQYILCMPLPVGTAVLEVEREDHITTIDWVRKGTIQLETMY
jgi:hypothetical protein